MIVITRVKNILWKRNPSPYMKILGIQTSIGYVTFLLAVFIVILLFLFQTFLNISKYFEYKTIMETQIRYEPPLFPAVTICNLNGYKASKIQKYENIVYELEQWKETEMATKNIKQIKKIQRNIKFIIASMPNKIKQQLSYNLDEFILQCSFNNRDCDMKRDFQLCIDPDFGNCYTYNFNESNILKNVFAGSVYGLRLLLNVNQSDYLPTTESAGIRMVVHEQGQTLFPEKFGFSASTGFISSFALKTKTLHRLNKPYGYCSDTFHPKWYIYAENYSPEGCYRSCFQHAITDACKCGDSRFPMPKNTNLTLCNAKNEKQKECLKNQIAIFENKLTENCECIKPCKERIFEVSSFLIPLQPAMNFICPSEFQNNTKGCLEIYRLNTAIVEIYYDRFYSEVFKEIPTYTLINLFSDFGLFPVLICVILISQILEYIIV